MYPSDCLKTVESLGNVHRKPLPLSVGPSMSRGPPLSSVKFPCPSFPIQSQRSTRRGPLRILQEVRFTNLLFSLPAVRNSTLYSCRLHGRHPFNVPLNVREEHPESLFVLIPLLPHKTHKRVTFHPI